jgi:hypothetical protein
MSKSYSGNLILEINGTVAQGGRGCKRGLWGIFRFPRREGVMSVIAIFHQLAAVTLELLRHESRTPRN